LGGKSPIVVFEDADLDAAARIAAMQYNNAGQVCLAGTRLLVAESIAYAFTAKLTELASRLVVGDPRLSDTNIGPLIVKEHFARVDGFVRRAIDDGARVVYGGGPDSAGSLYYKPTLLENVETASEIVQSEVFGPVLTLQTFSTEEEAIGLANATRYGLAASVVTADRERARRVAERVVAGTVWINSHYIRNLEAPFGGSRSSGIGREGGIHSFDFYCDIQTISEKNA
jgi:5-carboxymethyl-2-hydroxymuconic-semialdehyde dehydrogenase